MGEYIRDAFALLLMAVIVTFLIMSIALFIKLFKK